MSAGDTLSVLSVCLCCVGRDALGVLTVVARACEGKREEEMLNALTL